jgi:toxin ParE1/3/4
LRRYRLGRLAVADILGILTWSERQFGSTARIRYEALILASISDVVADPFRPGSQSRPELARDARTYHLAFSRRNVGAAVGAINRPRHLLVYRPVGDEILDIGRILHERMDLAQNLPSEYRSPGEG